MKSGVEAGELRNAGEETLRFADQSHRRGNVQRSEVRGGFQLFEDARRDLLVFAEGRASVDDAVAHSGGRRKSLSGELGGEDCKRVPLILNRLRLVV